GFSFVFSFTTRAPARGCSPGTYPSRARIELRTRGRDTRTASIAERSPTSRCRRRLAGAFRAPGARAPVLLAVGFARSRPSERKAAARGHSDVEVHREPVVNLAQIAREPEGGVLARE